MSDVISNLMKLTEQGTYFEYIEVNGSLKPSVSVGDKIAHNGFAYEIEDLIGNPVDDGQTPYIVQILARKIQNSEA